MTDFPLLKTGAVAQYPAERERQFSTEILQFLDGTEQRYRDFDGALLRWVIRLDLLDEQELAELESFYGQEQGEFGVFSFTDPWDGTEYPECSFENEEILAEFLEYHNGRTRLVIRQMR